MGTEHRKCEKVDTIENAAHTLTESGKMDCMLCEVNAFRKNLLKVKTEEINNISKIENRVDSKVAKIEKEALTLVQHIEQLKKEHINEMLLTQKKCREKLEREIEKIQDCIFCVDKCKEELEKAQGTENNVDVVMKWFTAKEKFHKIKQNDFKLIHLTLSTEKEPSWIKILTEMKKIANVKLCVITCNFQFEHKHG